MTDEPFNPNKFKVEDIFRAKERRRKDLAKLPFEKKIEIVKRLQTVVTEIKRQKRKSKAKAK
jgi:hypothetical protein